MQKKSMKFTNNGLTGIGMKLFPAKVFFILIISTPLFIPVIILQAATLTESEEKKSQMRQLETDLSREKEKFLKFDFKEKNLLEQLSNIEKDITEKRILLKELRDKIRLSKRELKKRRERLNRLENSLMEMEELVSKRVIAFYKYAKRGYLRILATTNGLDQLNHRMKYLKIILEEDQRAMKRMVDEQQEYRKEVSLIGEQLAAIASLEESENERLSSLKEGLEKKAVFLAKIHREKEFYETAVRELESAAQNLRETLLNLERDQHKKELLPSGFAELKGKLPLPLKGKVFRDKRKLGGKTKNTHKGIYISGPFGGDIKAVFQGRVDFSGQLKGYGQVIVINHGSRFFSISAYLLQRDKEVGEIVAKGEVIGQVGETGLLTGPALYFEIRKGETNLNPLKWLKVN